MAHRTSAPLTRDGAAVWSPPGVDPTTAEIRLEIERTRAEMSRTVNEIEERLAPSRVKEQVLEQLHDAKERVKSEVMADLDEAKAKVKETIEEAKTAVHDATVGRVETMVSNAKDTMTDASNSLVETIKENPIPAAMVAVGIGWLLVSGRSSGRTRRRDNPRIGVRSEGDFGEYGYSYGPTSLAGAVDRGEGIDFDREPGIGTRAARRAREVVGRGRRVAGRVVDDAQHAAHDASETAQRLAHEAGETAQRLAHEAGETVSTAAHQVEETGRRVIRRTGMQVRRAERTMTDGFESNPLAMGAVALAVGAAIGAALPHTRREDELLGKVRDQLVDRAQGMAREAIGKVEAAAGQASEALGSVKEAAGGAREAFGGGERQSVPGAS